MAMLSTQQDTLTNFSFDFYNFIGSPFEESYKIRFLSNFMILEFIIILQVYVYPPHFQRTVWSSV